MRRLLIRLGKQDTYADSTAANRETVYSGNSIVNEVAVDRFVRADIYGPVLSARQIIFDNAVSVRPGLPQGTRNDCAQ